MSHEGKSSRPPRSAAPKPKGMPGIRRTRKPRAQAEGDASTRLKPDTSGGLKIKLRGSDEEGGILTGAQMHQQIIELVHLVDKYPAGTRFKWATFYMTPVDERGNILAVEGPRNRTLTPYKSAADEMNV